MRIISGEFRGRVLKSPSDAKTRPTSDRLRETLFNIINPHISEKTRFLDLCAGTGAVGIEAISRGVCFADFVDKSRRACALIEQNLDLLKIPKSKSKISCLSAEDFVSRPQNCGWDMIFFDPPYSSDYGIVLEAIGKQGSQILNDDGILIVEHHFKNDLSSEYGMFERIRIVKQGETRLSLFANIKTAVC